MAEYRLNYGNGQVLETGRSLKIAKQAYAAQVEFDRRCKSASASLRLQKYVGEGEWVNVKVEVDGPRS